MKSSNPLLFTASALLYAAANLIVFCQLAVFAESPDLHSSNTDESQPAAKTSTTPFENKSVELPFRYDNVKVIGFNLPYFGGGPEEENIRSHVYSKQLALLDRSKNRSRPVDDYLIAINVELLYLSKFEEFRKHWRENLPPQEDPRAFLAAEAYINKKYRENCLNITHNAEELQGLLDSSLYKKLMALNPYNPMLAVALKQLQDGSTVEYAVEQLAIKDEYLSYLSSTKAKILDQWKKADEEGLIPEPIKRDVYRIPTVEFRVSSDGELKSCKIKSSSGSSAFDNEVVAFIRKCKLDGFPKSAQNPVRYIVMGLPFTPSKHNGIRKLSRSQAQEIEEDRHDFQERDREVKKMIKRDHEKILPWKDLVPYGDLQQSH